MFNVTNIKSVSRVQQLCVWKGTQCTAPQTAVSGTPRSLVKVSTNKRIINLLTNIYWWFTGKKKPLNSCYFYYYCYHNYHVECRTKLISQLQTIVPINTHIRHITLNKYSINNSIKLADLSYRLINQWIKTHLHPIFLIRRVTLNSSNTLTH